MTHQVAALVTGLWLELPTAGMLAVAAGAILPDVVDQCFAALGITRRVRHKLFNMVHRGTTHWFGWWLAIWLAGNLWTGEPQCRDLMCGLGIGGTSHVALDLLNPSGVPALPFTPRGKVSLHVCATGSLGEYVIFIIAIVFGLLMFGDKMLRLL